MPLTSITTGNHNDIITIVKNLNIPILDLHQKVFKNHHDLQLLYSSTARGTHPNEIGYKIIAETVFKEISKIEIKNK